MNKENLINAYFEGTLDEVEQREFEKLLSIDLDFAEEVAFRNRLKQAIVQEERANIKNKLLSFEHEQKTTKFHLHRWLSIAAALLLMGVLTIWWYSQEPRNHMLYDRYHETFPNIVQPLVRGENEPDERTMGFRAYDQGNYREAAELLSKCADMEGQFYAALSEMELGEYAEAAAIFEGLDISESDLKSFMLWYKSLNMIQLERHGEARIILVELEKETDFELREKVRELRQKIR